ncbi:DNA polymerase processivity subunit [Canid alphaherpesvirus 1]|nr:DNA polymerase processivity subunit [Canid alphaherpesvirus 1]QQL08453.1 DNA polymerase processivity subunit [Canid alphaherpesvirus 1]WHU31589.1 DNA polymerase processivity subunit [Canid alphaherpesvirus 1]WHU31663.1 DNA polymerase processivity subunit [Canid alphaherpesvirus 1]
MACFRPKTEFKITNHPSQIINNEENINSEEGKFISGRAVLEDQKLRDVISMLTPFSTSLKNSFIVFSDYGMMIHTSICGEQIYIPISKNQFSSYFWGYSDPAVFLANVDSKRGLLDVFKSTSKMSKVFFEISNPSQHRMLKQVIFTISDSNIKCSTLLKAEFSNYCIMLPSRNPDFSLELNKYQLNKILELNKKQNSLLKFESNENNVVISSESGSVSLNLDRSDSEGEDSASILKSATKKVNPYLVKHSGKFQTFKISLDDYTNFFPLLKKLKLTNTTVSINFFFTPTTNPMISLTSSKPIGIILFFFCTNELQHKSLKRPASPSDEEKPSKIQCGFFSQHFVNTDVNIKP